MFVIFTLLASSTAFADPTTQSPSTNHMIIVKSGQKIASLGASITEYGMNHPTGYIQLVIKCLTDNGNAVVPIAAGVSGNTSQDMLGRLDNDVISKKPDWVTIDAGGNDVWHNSVQFDAYMANMTQIVDKCQAAHIHVILQTCTPLFEDPNNDFNTKLAYYNTFQRYLAVQKHCVLADLNQAAWDALKSKTGTDNYLTVDGVHMNDLGNRVMATGLLKAMGLSDDQISKTFPPVD